jgi:bifunctional N6-L-threonylcarbamoyladenine synthase / protein kinase Bud32
MVNLKLIQQGAEAKIFLDEKNKLVIKDRVSKSYRLPALDNKLTKQRTKAETKLLTKANLIINSPLPEKSKEHNKIIMPYIDGEKLSTSLNDFSLEKQKIIIKKVGEAVAKIHNEDIIHGDLTTSNMILVNNDERENVISCNSKDKINNHNISNYKQTNREIADNNLQVFFIDFGLGYISRKIEDKAVDLHLLKQALEAKHFAHWKELFKEFQEAYSKENKESKSIYERMAAIEKRGRYRH